MLAETVKKTLQYLIYGLNKRLIVFMISNYSWVNITGDPPTQMPADYETLDSVVVARAEKEYAYQRSSLVDEYLSPQQLSPEFDVPPMRKLVYHI